VSRKKKHLGSHKFDLFGLSTTFLLNHNSSIAVNNLSKDSRNEMMNIYQIVIMTDIIYHDDLMIG